MAASFKTVAEDWLATRVSGWSESYTKQVRTALEKDVYTECWELGIRDDCLVMTRVKPVHPEYAKHWNMRGVMTDATRFHADKWVGYSKVLAWVSLSHKDTFAGSKRFQYFQTMYELERQFNSTLPVGGLPFVDTERSGKLFQRDDFSEDSHANDPKLVNDDYVPAPPEQVD